jgi:hypothetical protein
MHPRGFVAEMQPVINLARDLVYVALFRQRFEQPPVVHALEVGVRGYSVRYCSHSGWNVLPVSYLYSGNAFIAFATDAVSSPGSAAIEIELARLLPVMRPTSCATAGGRDQRIERLADLVQPTATPRWWQGHPASRDSN